MSQVEGSKAWFLLWLIIFALAFAWRAQNLDAFGLSNDEGAHLMWARLAVGGYPLYGETQAVQAPLFLEWVGLAFRLAGQTIQAGRWAMLTGFGLLAVALGWLAYRAGGRLAALAAMLLLGLAPLNFTFSRLVMAEVPATGLAVASLALLFVYLDKARKGWLLASGAALGLSFIVKALNPFVAVPIGLLLLVRSRRETRFFQKTGFLKGFLGGWCWPALLLDGLLWGIGLFIPLAVPFLIYDPAAIYDQLVAFRGDLRAAVPGSWPETGAHFNVFVDDHWGFWLLAVGGAVTAVMLVYTEKKVRGKAQIETQRIPNGGEEIPPALYPLTWATWLLAGVAMLLWHTPLFPHHFVVLLPPLILLGAGFTAGVAALWGNGEPLGRVWRAAIGESSFITDRTSPVGLSIRRFAHSYGAAVVLSLLIVAAAFNIPSIVAANQKTAAIVTGGREAEALDLLRAVSGSDDFIMGDSQLLIFMAGRRTPPPLGDVALVAIKAGRQTSARMIGLTRQYQAPAVVQWSLRLPWLPEYLPWVEANYLARRVWDGDHIIYFAARFPPGQAIPNDSAVRLGDALTLRGYQLDEASGGAGRDLNLKVYWQADASLTDDYTVFTQLLDNNGALVAGWDSQPLGGYFPTSHWPPNEIITDIVRLPLPPDLPAGDYTLITGLYLLETLERLPAPDGSNHVTLTTVALPD